MRDKTGVLGSSHLGKALEGSARKLGERCGSSAVALLAHRLTEYIGSVEDDRYSYIWRSAIEDHEQNTRRKDTRTVLIEAVRDAALGATTNSSSEAVSVAKSLLQSPYVSLVRVGIHVSGEHYGNVGTAFWACAKQNWFIDVPYWHELYWFIKKAFSKFSAAERTQFLCFVDESRLECSDKSRQEEWDEVHKRDLLHPAFGLGDSEVDNMYQSLVQRWGPVRNHPDFHSYTTGEWIEDSSPIGSDSIVAMSDRELVDFLINFVPESRSWDGPTYRGVATSISAAVRASEDGFAQRIGLFADLARPYQHGLLSGLKDRWAEDKRDIDWQATVALQMSIVSSPSLKADLEVDQSEWGEPTIHWVVSDIADLLKVASGTERHLPPELYKACLKVLRLILGATFPTEAEQADDAVSHAINTPRGRALQAFIHVALAMRREEVLTRSDSNETWAEVGPVFNSELASSESGSNADFAAMAGMYCANLHFINSQWTVANFDRLFSTSNELAWNCAAHGFSYQNYLYEWLFKCLVAGGHLRRMVYSNGLPDQIAEKALQFLGLAYLNGVESLDSGGLLAELVAELKVKELSQLCWFFWTLQRNGEPSPHSSKILAFWVSVADQVRSSQAEAHELQSALSQLAVFIQELTPALVQALTEAAPHAQIQYHGYILVENLARLVSKSPKEVAIIFRAAMVGFLPDFELEDVIRCVKGLAEAGETDEAEWICNTYAERGSTLLKETYGLLRAQHQRPL